MRRNRIWKWTAPFLSGLGWAWLLTVALVGCGGSKGAGGLSQYYGNYHPAGWMGTHGGQAVAGLSACTKCHEMSVLRVGSGIPTCLTTGCHHQATPGWADPGVHGLRAKLSPASSGGSLVSCQLCHGKDFSGGPAANACVTCHGVAAPHPVKPWRTSAGSPWTHTTTDPVNAAVCAQCHFAGSPNNPPGHPASPAPAGTQPGCYNATLCHADAGAPHALGAIWKDPTSAAFHGIEAKKDLKYCQSCHGTPGTTLFDGGTAATACSSCHSKTTGAGAHSTTWWNNPVQTFPGYVPGHRNATNGLSTSGSCVVCHAVTKTSTSTLPAAPSCYSANFANSEHAAVGCHANGPSAAPHPVPYIDTTHTTVTQTKFNVDCINCHAVSGTSPVAAAPLCATCHTVASPLASGSLAGTCLSCHVGPSGLPSGPTGASFPSIAGAHAKHMALPNVACATCHNAIGAGTLTHYNAANARNTPPASPAPVAMATAFNAKSGPASFSTTALTCSASSCHGGQTTPNWQTGSLPASSTAATSNTYCQTCHASGTAQFNSQNSGQHSKHTQAYCADCHNVLSGATQVSHWANLQTSAMEGPASASIQFSAAATGSRTYTVSNRNCALTCHFPNGSSKNHAPETW